MHFKYIIISFILNNINFIYSFLYDIEYSRRLVGGNNKYFGYAVFLQSSPATLVIGAPKSGANESGSVYQCYFNEYFNDSKCSEYFTLTANKEIKVHSMFGATINGGPHSGDIMICAPKYTKQYGASTMLVYATNGACYFLQDVKSRYNSILEPNSDTNQVRYGRYYQAFAATGFSLAYNEASQEFLLGTPGLDDWRGGFMRKYRENEWAPPQVRQLHPERETYRYEHAYDKALEPYALAGYAVAFGEFIKDEIFYVAGVPKGNEMRGMVAVINKHKQLVVTLNGDQIGSYFGSALCVADVNGDGYDDLLVGAFSYVTDAWDEGRVYEFLNDKNGHLTSTNKILVGRTPGSRFGTAITNLGKIALDNYDAVAVSAPYENDGKGAVYIYLGSPSGLDQHYRIQPEEDPSFGFSLSNAIDLTQNGFPELAVGAYKADSVTFLKSKTVFYYKFFDISVNPLLYIHKPINSFTVTFCIGLVGLLHGTTNIEATFESRIKNNYMIKSNQDVNNKTCWNYTAYFDDISLSDKLAFLSFTVRATQAKICQSCPVLSPTHSNERTYHIPFLNECGADQVCKPNFDIVPRFDVNELVVGTADAVRLQICIENTLEAAYGCETNLSTLLDDVRLKSQSMGCVNTKCSLPTINKKAEINYIIDMLYFNQITDKLIINFDINCLNYSKSAVFKLPLKYQQHFAFDSISNDIVYNKNTSHLIKSKFNYFIRNNGPSLAENVYVEINVPKSFKDNDLVHYNKVDINEELMSCNMSNLSLINVEQIKKPDIVDENTPESNLNVINSKLSDMKYVSMSCKIFKIKKNEDVKITIHFMPILPVIGKYFTKSFHLNSYLSYNGKMNDFSMSFIYDSKESHFPWYWILIGILIGIILLGATIYALYKFNFFNRNKMERFYNEEAEMQSHEVENEMCTQND